MIDKIFRNLQHVAESIGNQAGKYGGDAKDKAFKVIESWMQVLPKLEEAGLKVTSFALSVTLSPGLDIELTGPAIEFTPDRIEQMAKVYKADTGVMTVLNTIKTTYQLYQRTSVALPEMVIVKLRIRITPEVRVYLGEPTVE